MRALANFLAVLALTLVALPLSAQTDIDTDLFAGRITQPTPPPPPQIAPAPTDISTAMIMDTNPSAAAPQPRYQIFLNPLYSDSSSATTGVLTTGIIVPARRFRASLSYNYIDPSAAGNHLDSYGGSFRWKTLARPGAGLTVVGSESQTQHVSRKAQAGLVGEFLVHGPLTVSADVRWTRKSSATSRTDDLVPNVAAGLNFGKVIVGAGYTFNNDVDRQNGYEAQGQFIFKPGVVAAAVGKHGTWRLGFTRTFDFK
jgi:hypothetical protein